MKIFVFLSETNYSSMEVGLSKKEYGDQQEVLPSAKNMLKSVS